MTLEAIDTHEFSHFNATLLQAEGTLHTANEKSSMIHLIVGLVHTGSDKPSNSKDDCMTFLIADGMAVLQELLTVRDFKTGKELARAYVKLIDTRSQGYAAVRVVLDDSHKAISLKESTWEKRHGKVKEVRSFKVEDSTQIKHKANVLASRVTKDSIALYLAQPYGKQ